MLQVLFDSKQRNSNISGKFLNLRKILKIIGYLQILSILRNKCLSFSFIGEEVGYILKAPEFALKSRSFDENFCPHLELSFELNQTSLFSQTNSREILPPHPAILNEMQINLDSIAAKVHPCISFQSAIYFTIRFKQDSLPLVECFSNLLCDSAL